MARVSAEDCLLRLPNRFALCLIAAKRARQLAAGQPALVACDNKVAVTSLREIAAGRVTINESLEAVLVQHSSEMKAIDARRTAEDREPGPHLQAVP